GVAGAGAHTATLLAASSGSPRGPAAPHNDEIVKKCLKILKGIVKDGDHIVLGVNGGEKRPGSDHLAAHIRSLDPSSNARTFNQSVYAIEMPSSMGTGNRALWTVGVEDAVGNPNVRITVSLDGVEGAKNADEALSMLLARGETIQNSSWKAIQSGGYGTAWEMIKLRTAVRRQMRTWESIDWRMYNPKTGAYEKVEPKKFTLPDGSPLPDGF
ncbi:polymorphic toxin type 27 domain-containing protein, partial [Streptomyces sp. NPDC056528]|uniref:polymorphic toxin type 27 domain-containing protein n=1 Tax=Streptomyces sp. NPDC056528 TaxID=3345854 RepID=UPI0036A80CD2